jgi:hypothetical protein
VTSGNTRYYDKVTTFHPAEQKYDKMLNLSYFGVFVRRSAERQFDMAEIDFMTAVLLQYSANEVDI